VIDVDHEISSTRRAVGARILEAGEARVVTIRRVYDTTVDDMWDACTNPERIPRWFLPVEGELRLGGRYQLKGNAGGTVTRCDPPTGFDATWEFGGQTSWVELRLAPEGEGTLFTLAHIALVDDEHWDTYGPGATGVGWDLGMLGLGLHLASGEPVDAEAFLAWTTSDEARAFITASSAAWGEGAIDGGEAAETARARAARTTAFYTGG
jgi:uncharacterized protein YndB with AHSA1/START domain